MPEANFQSQPDVHSFVVARLPRQPSNPPAWPSAETRNLALLAFSHTVPEHSLYNAMRQEVAAREARQGAFAVSRLRVLTGLQSDNAVRRGCAGLLAKLSVARLVPETPTQSPVFCVYAPDEIFHRRHVAQIELYPKAIQGFSESLVFNLVLPRVVACAALTRREAFVAVCCAEGLTNAQIGVHLGIGEKTVKQHLRRIFGKLGVKHRAELIGCLLKYPLA